MLFQPDLRHDLGGVYVDTALETFVLCRERYQPTSSMPILESFILLFFIQLLN